MRTRTFNDAGLLACMVLLHQAAGILPPLSPSLASQVKQHVWSFDGKTNGEWGEEEEEEEGKKEGGLSWLGLDPEPDGMVWGGQDNFDGDGDGKAHDTVAGPFHMPLPFFVQARYRETGDGTR